jgi:hypothetical protein
MKRGVALISIMFAVMTLAAALWPAAEAADPPLRLAMAQEAAPGEPEFSGVFACLGCHSAGEQTPYQDSLDRFRMDEVLVWHREDKHSLAYCTLQGPAAQQMGKLLGYDVTTAKQCLACHAPNAELRSADPQTAPNFKLSEGVTCENCHGASRGWHRLHVLKDAWRELTPDQKKEHGMNDLRDPETRAQVCLDCHVGNEAQGQFVSHEMYAAGHPPLASVDVVGYAEQMPPHWKPAAARIDGDPFLATRQALAGNLLAGSRAMQQAAQVYDPTPDFATFDCDACHHELSSPSWRLARRTRGVPGRPEHREWSLRAAVWATDFTADDVAREQVHTLTEQLHAALQPRPFGNRHEKDITRETPLALAKIWEEQAQQLSDRKLTRVEVDRLVVTLLEEALDPARPPDYDTARSMAWLLRTALVDLEAFDPAEPSTAQLAWQMLDEQLGLSVPPRADIPTTAGIELACPVVPPQPIVDALAETLRPRANYDPAAFQDALRNFSRAVRASKTAQATAAARRR